MAKQLVLDFSAEQVGNALDELGFEPDHPGWVSTRDVERAITKLLVIAQEPDGHGLATDDLGLLVDSYGNVSIRVGRATFEEAA